MSDRQHVIVFALFPGVTQLDFTGPHEVFSYWPGASVILASAEGGTIEATGGMTFAGVRQLAAIPECDVVCVPGGRGVTDNAIGDAVFLSELRRLAATAKFVTSVCTGSLALGAAGLLRGKRAACHWAWRDLLTPFGAIPDRGRVVRDGNVITGGGVTAGIDFALNGLPSSRIPKRPRRSNCRSNTRRHHPSMPGYRKPLRPRSWHACAKRISAMAAQRRGAVESAAARLAAI